MASKPKRMPILAVFASSGRLAIFSDTFSDAEKLLKLLEKYGIETTIELRSPWCG